MTARTIDYHINPKNVVILNENQLAQQVGQQEENTTIDNEIDLHRAKLEIPVRIKKSGRNIWTPP